MKFTLNWLKDFLETDADLDTITRTLTAIGLEVERVEDHTTALESFTVAEITHAEKHPDADKLQVCKVKSDETELQIVCGAPNAREGIKVALAKVGNIIPNGEFKIKKSKIRGVESCGMLCSADELGLGEDSAGIIELPESAEIGTPITEVLGLNDPVIEIAITPNRGDCLGVHGIARDLAAAGIGKLTPLTIPDITTTGDLPVKVIIQTPHCSMFSGTVITGIKNNSSPAWLQQRLKAIGLRPISVLVDITNYFTHTYARPLHVYDVAKLNGDIIVREATAGESFDALNDKSYTLKGGECVIADQEGMLGLGGIVGGVPSSVTEETTDVLLEAAWFEPEHIAQVGRTHSIDTDARYRFERHVDTDFTVPGAQLATQMILELCGGKACSMYVAGEDAHDPAIINYDAVHINQIAGMPIDTNDQKAILERLGFLVSTYTVTAPSWRPDVRIIEDVAEEVLRIYGYDNIADIALPKPQQVAGDPRSAVQKRQKQLRQLLARRGLCECVSWGFVSSKEAELFAEDASTYTLQNPISSELNIMRPSLLPHLISAASRNTARGHSNNALFEIGACFSGTYDTHQQMVACTLRSGDNHAPHWQENARAVDMMDAKADLFALLNACGLDTNKLQLSRDVPGYYHPGRAAAVKLGPKNILGYFGQLHPLTLEKLGCEQDVFACELLIDNVPLPKAQKAAKSALQTSDYPSSQRDFAFIVDETLEAGELLRAIRGTEKKLLRAVTLFDVYQGKGVAEGKKSLALSITLQADDRTLTDTEIDDVAQKVVDAAGSCGAVLRG